MCPLFYFCLMPLAKAKISILALRQARFTLDLLTPMAQLPQEFSGHAGKKGHKWRS